MSVEQTFAFDHSSGKKVYAVTLEQPGGLKATLLNLGNTLTSLRIGETDLVLGFENPAHYVSPLYLSSYPYLGTVIGRTANRIKDGKFTLDGKIYQLDKNLGEDNLHGGREGFDQKVWDVISLDSKSTAVRFRYISPSGDAHFPGTLHVEQEYRLTNNRELVIDSFAHTDAPTLVNLTHHDYFNLNGKGSIGQHRLKLNCSHYLGQDDHLVADGRRIPVDGTAFDFRIPGEVLAKRSSYDQSFCIDGADGQLRLAAEITGNGSGITMQVLTTDPIVHVYTGSGLPELRIDGQSYFGPGTGICFETQKEPNAINVPEFSNTILRPGETYFQQTVYRIL